MDKNEKLFSDKRFADEDFSKKDLSNARFVNCTFGNCDFTKSNLSDAIFINSKVEDSDSVIIFHGSNLKNTLFSFCEFPFSTFNEAKLNNTKFEYSNFVGAVFADSFFEKVIFSESNLKECSFNNTNVFNSSFIKCDLSGSSFKESIVCRDSISDCKMDDVIVKYALKLPETELKAVVESAKENIVTNEAVQEVSIKPAIDPLQKGIDYLFGRNCTVNYNEAFKCFESVALNPNAYYYLAYCYYFGYGTLKNNAKSKEYAQKSLQYNKGGYEILGHLYYFEKNYVQAVANYKVTAVDNIYQDSQCNLGICYFYGNGVTKDINESFRLFNLSANSGNLAAITWLGYLYYIGQPIKDYNSAIMWFEKAAKRNDSYSKNYLDLNYALNTLKNNEYYNLLLNYLGKGK
jgi:tetratricopeptide (TPR) repeat protein